MSSEQRLGDHFGWMPALSAALGIGLPLIVVDSSLGQTAPASQVLYYGWQTDDHSANAASSDRNTAAPDVDSTDASVIVPNDLSIHPSTELTHSLTFSMPTASAVPLSVAEATEAVSDFATSPAAGNASGQMVNHLPQLVSQTQSPTEVPLEPEVESATWLDGIAPAGNSQPIADIQVRFVDENKQVVEGHTRPSVFTRELDLEVGTPYEQALAQQGLDRILQLDIVRAADIELEPAADQTIVVVNIRERSAVAASLGFVSPSPAALEGPFQQNPVLGAGNNESTGLAADGSVRLLNLAGNDQSITFQLRGGERVFDTELSLIDPWIGNDPTGVRVNLFNQRSVQGVFVDGDRDVDLSNGNTPWVHRLGGGIEVFRPVSPDMQLALGVNYQRVSIHNSAFEEDTFSRDETGRRLIVSDDHDDLLTVNLSADLDQRDSMTDPTRGSRLRFGIDQAVPVGDANIKFTRFGANFVQYLPLNLFGFTSGPRTLVLNAQAGTMLGEVPPYEAFNLSSGPLGDYAGNSFGTGKSFALLAAEYRFPVANFSLFRQDVRLGGNLFGSYATVLGTDNEVIGQPSISRDKPGAGWAYGIGLRANTDFGIFRLEFGLNDLGESAVLFTVGDRF